VTRPSAPRYLRPPIPSDSPVLSDEIVSQTRPHAIPTATVLRFCAVSLVLLLLAHLVDRWAYQNLVHPGVTESDLGRMLRVMGFLPLWAIGAAALVLSDWPRRTAASVKPALTRGALLLGSAAAGGIVAELLKLLLRRERAWAHEGAYVFRPFTERPFSTGGLALPSSHALVAFGGLAMMAYLFPRAGPVWYALAVGAAYSRVAAGAHFVSDVVLSGIVGIAVAALIWHWHLRRSAVAGDADDATTLLPGGRRSWTD
jgi:membrane-associated phospholipid phosphatase